MSADDLLKHTEAKAVPADADTPKPEEKEEKKGGIGKLLFIGAIVAAGAIFLRKKFKGNLGGEGPSMAP